ncbi:MAG: hypothetical protein ACRD8O_02650 [Bryobacteraceae bacterium]
MRRILVGLVALTTLAADVRVNLRLGAGHPIRRPRTVVVHRAPLAVSRTVVYAAPVVWTRAVVAPPSRNRVVWEDTETLNRREDWVDALLPVNNTGDALLLRVEGRVQIDFAEVHFRNGQVQVVDFNEVEVSNGTSRLHDFAGGRYVENVRIVARARSPRAKLTVLMRK